MRYSLLLAVAAQAALAGCVSGSKIRADAEVIRADVERAKRTGAYRCAPRELATAEANLDFALGELTEGSSFRAGEHIRAAEAAAKRAVQLSRTCGPRQVLVRDKPPERTVVVQVEETDRDGDGIKDNDDQCVDQPEDKDGFQDSDGCPDPDNDNDGLLDAADKCPMEAGPPQNLGCPTHDKDGDGIDDEKDKCPDEPEDKDGFQDQDGCPDLDNDRDGIADANDRCPNAAGPSENNGCPDADRDTDGIVDRLDRCPDQPGISDEQGCPRQYKLVVVRKDRIEI